MTIDERTNEHLKNGSRKRGGNEFSEKTDLYFYFINDSAQHTTVERTGIQFRFTIPMRLAEMKSKTKIREAASLFGSFWRVEFYFKIGRAHV